MITRFAPSPTGPLHLGHAYSALTVWQVAHRYGGTALLRIEDTDSTRIRPEHEDGIYADLAWLGLTWPSPVLRQSEHYTDYWGSLDRLATRGLIYPCSCTRKTIMSSGARQGVDGMVYPGTCRHRPMSDATAGDAIRLNLNLAVHHLPESLTFEETGVDAGIISFITAALQTDLGDPVLRRKETGDPAYHLACVHDDARQNVSHVVRGTDLQALTPLHVALQHLLALPTPVYHHHCLVRDGAGKRLAKIDRSKALAKYRAEGVSVADIKRMIGFVD